ncbi:hypothetical protein [Actinoplanes aureus]|uniref:Uncharacterized protein n=1 Tax=Actinoplanes aureus TaxID=2792083 RepID=A0A931C761_9ACTN|nr:hypothetical protein [Actinoplanes aureus]MBG0564665.1 hypothetical protein [Actinoplanes aureus]
MSATTLRVMVFGERGAGKTLYLAGLFRGMSVSGPGSVFTLQTGEVDRLKLNRIYADAVNPLLKNFPPSTHWQTEPWRFDCQITNRHGTFRPLSVEYLDYSGEMLDPLDARLGMTDEEIEVDPELRALRGYRDHADAYLLMIDGLKLLRMLRGAPELAGWLEHYLSDQLQVMEQRLTGTGGRPPLHVVVSKWDLLDGRMVDGVPVTLGAVAGLVARQPTFAAHLDGRAQDRDAPVRVIPVSVTGPFAALDEETGEIVKVPGRPVQPYNLDVPFTALLPDTIRWRREQLLADTGPSGEGVERKLNRRAALLAHARAFVGSARGPLAERLDRWATRRQNGGSPAMSIATAGLAGELLHQLGAVLDEQESRSRARLREIQEEHQRRRQAVATESEAITLALQGFAVRLAEFEEKNPGSLLGEVLS